MDGEEAYLIVDSSCALVLVRSAEVSDQWIIIINYVVYCNY